MPWVEVGKPRQTLGQARRFCIEGNGLPIAVHVVDKRGNQRMSMNRRIGLTQPQLNSCFTLPTVLRI